MRKNCQSLVPVILALHFAGCSDGLNSNPKPIGSEGGSCTLGSGCDPGLVCLSQVCVRLDFPNGEARDAGLWSLDSAKRANDTVMERFDVAADPENALFPGDDVALANADATWPTGDVARPEFEVGARPVDAARPLDGPTAQTDGSGDQITCNANRPGGIGVPAGTLATASSTYLSYAPVRAIDGDLTNSWNAGTNTGWLQLNFPAPTFFTGLRILAFALPSTVATYTVTADALASPIGSATRTVREGTFGSLLDPIDVIPGTYSRITLTIDARSSWVAVGEISLITPSCP